MKTRDVELTKYVAVYGKPQTALAMNLTRQRVQQMMTTDVEVFVRVEPAGKIIAWYILRRGA